VEAWRGTHHRQVELPTKRASADEAHVDRAAELLNRSASVGSDVRDEAVGDNRIVALHVLLVGDKYGVAASLSGMCIDFLDLQVGVRLAGALQGALPRAPEAGRQNLRL
jgi:hypothetical protein